jgi:hypothetical protein
MNDIYLIKPVSEMSTLECLNVLSIFISNVNCSENDRIICKQIIAKLELQTLNPIWDNV